MTIIKKVRSGEDIKGLYDHPNIYNLTDKELLDLNDNSFYLVKEHIGYYKSLDKSGIFILKITEVTDELINSMIKTGA